MKLSLVLVKCITFIDQKSIKYNQERKNEIYCNHVFSYKSVKMLKLQQRKIAMIFSALRANEFIRFLLVLCEQFIKQFCLGNNIPLYNLTSIKRKFN